jgi:hypothetical protein
MGETYVPYSQTRPKTTDLRALAAELDRVRDQHGRSSSQALEAFNALAAAYVAHGTRIDALPRYDPNEERRFFAHTIPGPDGHIYWDGGQEFIRNDGMGRRPIRWWWQHLNGPLSQYEDITVMCGERRCINPEHAEKGRAAARRRFTDEQILGALQVVAMRLGHSPTTDEWRAGRYHPDPHSMSKRFGSWGGALKAAGLPPTTPKRRNMSTTPDACIRAVWAARDLLGHWPLYDECRDPQVSKHLEGLGLPVQPRTFKRHLKVDRWADVLKAAGKRG